MAVLRMNILSKFLGMITNITVFLPTFSPRDTLTKPDFYKTGMKFQTLYLLHGGIGDDPDYVNLTSIVRYADENHLAVVMPAAYNSFYTDNPNGPRYWRYISEELPELCQALFPLSDQREDNFVAGLSMGGFGAMKMGLMLPERFAAVLCMSGTSINPDKVKAFFNMPGMERPDPDVMPRIDLSGIFGDLDHFKGSQHDMWAQARRNMEAGKKTPRFFLTSGDKDFALEHVNDAYAMLTGLGYDTFLEIVPGYGHEWSFWDLTLNKALSSWLPLRREIIYPG